MAWTKEQSIKYKNEFIAKSYDRINLTVPKGKKEIYKEYAEKQGTSLNGYINQLLERDINTRQAEPTEQ